MKRLGFPGAAILLLMGLVYDAGSADKPLVPRIHTVRIENMTFSPAAITVRAGDTVVFINADLVPHTVTERTLRQFDSGIISPNATWKILCDAEGMLEYRCSYHPTMLGSITVAAADSARRFASAPIELCGAP